MIDPANVPPVASDEQLARYVLHRRWIRPDGKTIKQDAFFPPASLRFSVTRHLLASETELWSVGNAVAAARNLSLYGRADFQAHVCSNHKLSIEPAQIAGNPNHAEIVNWPVDKPLQKIVAQELAASANFIPLIAG